MKPITENVQAVVKVKYYDPDTGKTEVRESDNFILALGTGEGYYTYLNGLNDMQIIEAISSMSEVALDILSDEGRKRFKYALNYYANDDDETMEEKELN